MTLSDDSPLVISIQYAGNILDCKRNSWSYTDCWKLGCTPKFMKLLVVHYAIILGHTRMCMTMNQLTFQINWDKIHIYLSQIDPCRNGTAFACVHPIWRILSFSWSFACPICGLWRMDKLGLTLVTADNSLSGNISQQMTNWRTSCWQIWTPLEVSWGWQVPHVQVLRYYHHHYCYCYSQ